MVLVDEMCCALLCEIVIKVGIVQNRVTSVLVSSTIDLEDIHRYRLDVVSRCTEA